MGKSRGLKSVGKILRGGKGAKVRRGRFAKRIAEEAGFEAAFGAVGSLLTDEQKNVQDAAIKKEQLIPTRSQPVKQITSTLISPKVDVQPVKVEIKQLPPITLTSESGNLPIPNIVSGNDQNINQNLLSKIKNLEIRVTKNEQRLDLVGVWVQDTNKKIEEIQKRTLEVNVVLKALSSVSREARDDFRRQNLKNERQKDEDDIENKKYTNDIFNRMEEGVSEIIGSGKALLRTLATPLAMIGAGIMMSDSSEGEGGIVESAFDIIDKVETSAIGGVVAAKTLANRGINKLSMVRDLREFQPTRGIVAGVDKFQMDRRAKQQAKKFADLRQTMGIVDQADITKTSTAASGIMQTVNKIADKSKVAKKALQYVNKARTYVSDTAKMAKKWTKKAQEAINNLPSGLKKIAKKGLRGIVKWTIIFEIFNFLWRQTEMFMLGSIDENKWHEGNKEQINRLLKLFGAPWALAMIFGAAGTVIPVLGNIAGGVAGLIVGILFADTIYDALGFETLVNAFYDFIFRGDLSGFKNIANKAVNFVVRQVPKFIAQGAMSAVRGVGRFLGIVDDEEQPRPSQTIESGSVKVTTETEMAEGSSTIIQTSHPETGAGYTIPGAMDQHGRPVVFSREAASAFQRMIEDSGGIVKASDVASSQRSQSKNQQVGGARRSKHLHGIAMDIHGESNAWIRQHGANYGWKAHDYSGTHGGHFIFEKSARASQVATTSPQQKTTPIAVNDTKDMDVQNTTVIPVIVSSSRGRNKGPTNSNPTTSVDTSSPSYKTRDTFVETGFVS